MLKHLFIWVLLVLVAFSLADGGRKTISVASYRKVFTLTRNSTAGVLDSNSVHTILINYHRQVDNGDISVKVSKSSSCSSPIYSRTWTGKDFVLEEHLKYSSNVFPNNIYVCLQHSQGSSEIESLMYYGHLLEGYLPFSNKIQIKYRSDDMSQDVDYAQFAVRYCSRGNNTSLTLKIYYLRKISNGSALDYDDDLLELYTDSDEYMRVYTSTTNANQPSISSSVIGKSVDMTKAVQRQGTLYFDIPLDDSAPEQGLVFVTFKFRKCTSFWSCPHPMIFNLNTGDTLESDFSRSNRGDTLEGTFPVLFTSGFITMREFQTHGRFGCPYIANFDGSPEANSEIFVLLSDNLKAYYSKSTDTSGYPSAIGVMEHGDIRRAEGVIYEREVDTISFEVKDSSISRSYLASDTELDNGWALIRRGFVLAQDNTRVNEDFMTWRNYGIRLESDLLYQINTSYQHAFCVEYFCDTSYNDICFKEPFFKERYWNEKEDRLATNMTSYQIGDNMGTTVCYYEGKTDASDSILLSVDYEGESNFYTEQKSAINTYSISFSDEPVVNQGSALCFITSSRDPCYLGFEFGEDVEKLISSKDQLEFSFHGLDAQNGQTVELGGALNFSASQACPFPGSNCIDIASYASEDSTPVYAIAGPSFNKNIGHVFVRVSAMSSSLPEHLQITVRTSVAKKTVEVINDDSTKTGDDIEEQINKDNGPGFSFGMMIGPLSLTMWIVVVFGLVFVGIMIAVIANSDKTTESSNMGDYQMVGGSNMTMGGMNYANPPRPGRGPDHNPGRGANDPNIHTYSKDLLAAIPNTGTLNSIPGMAGHKQTPIDSMIQPLI